MTHDRDDATIGGYLAGELPADEWDAFEEHLLTCDPCWNDVHAGRRGRILAGQAHEPVPDRLQERIHATIAEQRPVNRRPRLRPVAAGALILATIAAAVVAARSAEPGGQPPQIALAVAGYRADRLPGTTIPAQTGPDLTALDLLETGAGTGHLAGQPVTGYAYRDRIGRRILLYLSEQPFPMPAHADHPTSPDGATIATHRGVAVLCARHPYTTLILGEDDQLVWHVATTLHLT